MIDLSRLQLRDRAVREAVWDLLVANETAVPALRGRPVVDLVRYEGEQRLAVAVTDFLDRRTHGHV